MRSIAGIALRNNTVFVAKRMPGGTMGGKWEFPGGKAESGETDRETIARELNEEFGLSVKAGDAIGESSFVNGDAHYVLVAMLVSFEGEPLVLREHEQALWVDASTLSGLDLSDSDRSLLPFIMPLL